MYTSPPQTLHNPHIATHNVSTLNSLQDNKLPLDLALEHNDLALEHTYSAGLLALLMRGAGSAALSDGSSEHPLPLVSVAEMRVFEALSPLLDTNPRRLKRIINVYALVTEVAKRKLLSGVNSTACMTV